jgi:hypothetical protein
LNTISCLTLLILSLGIATPQLAQAARFHNAYTSFELPPNWKCQREHTETVCTSRYGKKSKEAIIILTAKEAGPSDSFANYLNYLKTPKTILTKAGKPNQSKLLHVKDRNIANHKWVDGMHLGSEVTSYYTRYLATIKDRIAILVTFSAHQAHYTKYSKDFIRAIESLRVVATKDLLANRPNLATGTQSETIGAPIGQVLPPGQEIGQLPDEPSGFLGMSAFELLGLFALLLAIGLYAYYKLGAGTSKKKKVKKKVKKKRKKRVDPPV